MGRILLSAILLIATLIPRDSLAQPAIASEIAPTGKLRVAMNAGTPVLLMRTPDGKTTGGVGVEVGKFVAEKLGVPLELVPYPNSSAYIQSFGKGEWDIGFGAKTPLVAEKADFILDLLLNDYLFASAPGRPLNVTCSTSTSLIPKAGSSTTTLATSLPHTAPQSRSSPSR